MFYVSHILDLNGENIKFSNINFILLREIVSVHMCVHVCVCVIFKETHEKNLMNHHI